MEGTTLSHFRILSKIGQGGMGVVYKAEDVNLGRTVAIKVLPAELVQDPKRRARFVSEARTAAAVTHPNIATIYEIDEADGITFIAMEYLKGETLRERIGAQALPLKQAVQWGAKIAEGLAAAHGAKIVHRDLKPDNVMITRDGHVKILDFGLARLLERTPPSDGVEMTTAATQALTDPDAILGTPAYMSPEQARGLEIDFRSDIFSFGCTFYEMLTGHRAFRGRTSTDTLSDILNKTPVPVANLNPDVPSSVQWVLDKCLDKEADERYRDTRDLVVDLHHVQRDSQSLASGKHVPSTQQVPVVTQAPFPTPQPTPQPLPSGTDSADFGVHTPSQQSVAAPSTLTSGSISQTVEVSSRKRYVTLAVAVVVTAAAALGLPRLFNRESAPAPATTEANSLAIFAFENLADANDPQRYGQIFQDVLITALSGLEPLKVYSGQRLFDIQKQLSNSGDKGFDKELTTDVARHAGAEHMLTGSLGQLGDKWILNCQMVQVDNGTVVFSKRIDGEDLYQVADVLTSELKDDLRIAAPSEVSTEISVREKTSSSLDAYRTYLEGTDFLNTNKYQEAAALFREAIRLDKDFGQAYYKYALALSWPGTNPDAAKAVFDEFLSRELYTSDREKRMAEAARARLDGQYAEILPDQLALVEDYPDEKETWYELGETYFHYPGGGKDEEALQAFEKALELDPDFLLPYQHIFDSYWNREMYDRALARADALIQRDPSNPTWHRFKASTLAFVTDESGIDAVVNEALAHQKTAADRRELYKDVATKLWAQAPSKQEEYYKKALAADPDHDDPEIVQALMQQLQSRARWDEYEKWIRDELDKTPENSVMQRRLWFVLASTRRYDDAETYARQRSQEDPDDAQWARNWALSAIRNGDETAIQSAMAAAERAAKTTDDRRFMYSSFSDAYNGRGDVNRALQYLETALAVEPDSPYPFLYNSIGWREHARGRYAAAKRAFETTLELNPEFTAAYFGLNAVARSEEDDEQAEKMWNRALETMPPGPFHVLGPANRHLRAGELAQARVLLEQFLANPAPDWAQLNRYSQIGNSYLQAGFVDEAIDMFERAARLEVSRRQPLALNRLGLGQLVAGDYAAGEATLRRALEVEYPDDATRTRLASALMLQGKFDEAAQVLEDELSFRPHLRVDQLLALVRSAQSRHDEARVLAERCVAMDSSRTSHEILAWTLITSERNVEQGIREAKRALELPIPLTRKPLLLPLWPPAEHSLGLAALQQGNPDEAVAHLRRAAERMPSRESLQADLRRVESMVSGTP